MRVRGFMRTVTLAEIAASVDVASFDAANGSLTIDGVSTDSRTICPGEIFWALPGDRYDGHDFIHQSVARGARAAVVQVGRAREIGVNAVPLVCVDDTKRALGQFAAYYRRTCGATVIAVTGSVGKTSTREAIYSVLSRQW